MRRSRTALTAWPAFADLMTVLAVLGLAIAAGVASIEAPSDEVPEDLPQKLRVALAAARERNAALEERIEELEEELEDRDIERRLGSFPCLGTQSGSRTAPVPLLRIVVESGYRVTRLWPPGANVEGIPRLDEAITHGLMQEGDLRGYASGMHAYGDDDDTYGRSCRFWVELRKGETTSQTTFARALGIVNQYFLISNSAEVNRILVGTEQGQ